MNAAVHDGEQTVFLRKGGIDEKGFVVESSEFLLYPSFFHAEPTLLKPGMKERYQEAAMIDPKSLSELLLQTYVKVTGRWATNDPEVASKISAFHIGTDEFLANRLKWRRGAPITIIELQAFKLREPIVIRPALVHFGCFSWIKLLPSDIISGSLDLNLSTPSLPESEFQKRQMNLRSSLRGLAGVEEL
jgi:hypothetical protein